MIDLPRYKLGVGDELRYRMTGEHDAGSEANRAGGRSQFSIDWNFHVTARHADGNSRLVFSESRTQAHQSASGERTIRTFDNDGFFDIAADGTLVENWTITPLANPTAIFPRLPADRSQIATGWQSTLQLDGAHRQYVAAKPDAAQGESVWQFVEDSQTQLDPIYQARRQRDYLFDLRRGLVTSVSTDFRRGWPASFDPAVSKESIELIEATRTSSADAARVRQEADRYFKRCAEYRRLVDLALWDLSQTAQWLEKAGIALEQLESTVTVEFIRKMLRRKLKLHRQECGSLLSDAERLVGTIDKPASDWQSVDFDGIVHALKDYEGKVLVLCFWNRGCTWSIRCLLALNALAAEMRDRPIVFLGVNGDTNIEDAKFVWRTLKVAFPSIRDIDQAHAISSAYGVDGYPTTVVIDACGIIRRVRAGYSYGLSCSLARELTRLVSGQPCGSCD